MVEWRFGAAAKAGKDARQNEKSHNMIADGRSFAGTSMAGTNYGLFLLSWKLCCFTPYIQIYCTCMDQQSIWPPRPPWLLADVTLQIRYLRCRGIILTAPTVFTHSGVIPRETKAKSRLRTQGSRFLHREHHSPQRLKDKCIPCSRGCEITGLVPKLGQWRRDLGHGIPLFAKDGLAYMQVGHQVDLARVC